MKPRGLFGSFAHVFVSRPERVQSSAAPVIVPALPPAATSERFAVAAAGYDPTKANVEGRVNTVPF